MPEINLREWKIVGLLALIVVIITSIPNLIGMVATPSNSVFWGLQTINPRDTPIYYSQIEQAREGHFLFTNLYTSEDEPRFIFDPFWLGVGLFAKIFFLSPFAAYQLIRIFLILLFLAIAYIFIAYFFTEEKKRQICFTFLLFASGIGSLVWSFAELGFLKFWPPPMDLWSIESSIFYTLYHSPHFIASLLLTIVIFFLILRAFEENKFIYSFAAGSVALFLFFFHPYHVPTIFVIPGLYIIVQSFKKSVVRWAMVKHYFILVTVSSPAILYHFWTLSVFWTRQQFAMQNNLPTPPFYNLFLTYGFLLFFALVGIIVLVKNRNKNDKEIFLLSWFAAQIVLPFLPFLNFQRKLIEGLHFILVILTIEGLYSLKIFLKKKKSFLLSGFKNPLFFVPVFFLALGFSPYYIIIRDINLYRAPYSFVFLSENKIAAMAWLKSNTDDGSIILSGYDNSNAIPAFAVRKVYFGSNGNTAAAEFKTEQIKMFFENYDKKARVAFLKINKINYIFYGPEEKKSENFNPDQIEYLEKVYENTEVDIYQVKN